MKQRLIYLVLPAAALLAGMPSPAPVQASNSSDTYRQLVQLMDVFERVRAEYVEEVTDEQLLEGAINGMLASLDPHSSFLDARDFDTMQTQTEGEYGGLGLTVTSESGVVRVVAPTDDTPAARAGIEAGDYITHIDDELIYGLTLNEAVDKMRGVPGTPIKLSIVREGVDEPIDVTLVREIIELRPVKWEVEDGIGLIRISTFNKQTGEATRDAIEAIEAEAGDALLGYIVDLRSNPGGLLDQAIEVSDAFLAEGGEIVSQRGRRQEDLHRYFARTDDLTDGKPIVVLIDEGSASAAEIVAGALQDHRRALVVGVRSFGKGSVQTLIPLGPETALRLTTARYYTPSGRSVQEEGIEPDIIVPQLSDENHGDRRIVRESDLRRALRNNDIEDRKLIEEDDEPNPRFTLTAEELKEKGVEDFQLNYARKILLRLDPERLQTADASR